MIHVEYSDNNTSDEIIIELMKVEADVYEPEYRGEYASICARFNKFKDMFVLAYDEDKVIGYLCYFPISSKLHSDIISNDAFHDDDIRDEDVLGIEKENNIYLLSVALMKRYQGRGIGQKLMDGFFSKMRHYSHGGNEIEDILASVVTEQGDGLARKYGMIMLKDNMDTEGYKLFYMSGEQL